MTVFKGCPDLLSASVQCGARYLHMLMLSATSVQKVGTAKAVVFCTAVNVMAFCTGK